MDLPSRKEYEETKARNQSESLALDAEHSAAEIEEGVRRITNCIRKGYGVSPCYLTTQAQKDAVIALFKEEGWKITFWMDTVVRMELL